MSHRFIGSALLLGASFFLLISCGGGSSESGLTAADSAALKSNQQKATKVFISIPSPLEMTNMIKATGVRFDKSCLNPASNAIKYNNTLSQALNLGIYSADLSYCSTFDQTQDAMQYMGTCKKLADQIGVMGGLSENTIARLEKNVNNKDSLLNLVSETYAATDAYLKENDRASLSAIIVAGGWLEATYLSTRLAKSNPKNISIMERIAEQKEILNNLVSLLESYPQDANIKSTITEFKALQSLFEPIRVTAEKGEVSVDMVKNTSQVTDRNSISITPEQLGALTKAIEDLRTKYTK
jgi:hypothetical protein